MGVILNCSVFVALAVSILGGLFVTNKNAVFEFVVDRALNQYELGTLCLEFPRKGQVKRLGKNAKASVCDAEIVVQDEEKFYEKVATAGGNIGLGEAYMFGYWSVKEFSKLPQNGVESASATDTSPLAQTLHHLQMNQFRLPMTYPRLILTNLFNIGQLKQWLARRFWTAKTVEEDQETISYHYDLGNDFFASYLGETLSGSCAVWTDKTKTLEDAQNNKWELIIKKLRIDSSHRVLDVGSGWGYFCHKVVSETGASCTGIILSKEQLEFSRNRFHSELCSTQKKQLGDPGCLEFVYCDYRNVVKHFGQDHFDRIVSVGMVEHVHSLRLQEYFTVLSNVLKPDGWMLIHGITNPDVYPEALPISRATACQIANFINKYIFPGGCILHVNWWNEAALKAGLVVMHEEHFGKHYAKTLKQWYDNMVRNWPQLKQKNPKYDDVVYRMHEFYFAVCESSFRTMRVDLSQVVYYKDSKSTFHNDFNWLPKIRNANQ